MDKFDILVKRALSGKYISERFKDCICNDVVDELNESHTSAKSVNIDSDDNITAKDENDIYTNNRSDEGNDIIKGLLDTIIEYIRRNGVMLTTVTRVLSNDAKEDAFPLVSLCKRKGMSTIFKSIADADIKYFGESYDKDGSKTNNTRVGEYEVSHGLCDAINNILKGNEGKDIFENVKFIFQKLGGSNNITTKPGKIGNGEFLLGCICKDLTMSTGNKKMHNNATPDLGRVTSKNAAQHNYKGERPFIEVKNCNELREYNSASIYNSSGKGSTNHETARLNLGKNISTESADESSLSQALNDCYKDASLFIWYTDNGMPKVYNIYSGNFQVVDATKDFLDENKDRKGKKCKLFKITSDYAGDKRPLYIECSGDALRLYIFKKDE